jgi:uncharacterized protein involved in exopolysaccharide biosynthesis
MTGPALPGALETRALTPAERLRALEAQYAANAAVYRGDHPDLRRMQREIAALKAETGSAAGDSDTARLEELEEELARLRKRYSDDHPDVQRVRRAIAALNASERERPAQTVAARVPPATQTKPDNPAYVSLVAQIDAAKREASHLSSLRDDLRAKQRAYDARLLQIPEVEREYRELTRDYDNAQERYRDIRAKEMQAQVSLELEKDQKAERFSIGEPATLPETPIWPKRMRIALLGFVGSLVAGIGLAWLRDMLNPAIKGPLELARIATAPVLTPIPYIETARERAEAHLRGWLGIGLLVLLAATALLALDRLWKPLPRIAEDLMRRLPL